MVSTTMGTMECQQPAWTSMMMAMVWWSYPVAQSSRSAPTQLRLCQEDSPREVARGGGPPPAQGPAPRILRCSLVAWLRWRRQLLQLSLTWAPLLARGVVCAETILESNLTLLRRWPRCWELVTATPGHCLQTLRYLTDKWCCQLVTMASGDQGDHLVPPLLVSPLVECISRWWGVADPG